MDSFPKYKKNKNAGGWGSLEGSYESRLTKTNTSISSSMLEDDGGLGRKDSFLKLHVERNLD